MLGISRTSRIDPDYDVVVVGGGHAGTEAAWAAASVLGTSGRVALVTMDPSRIGQMSCNPAIGGLGKGQLVREVDALGGLMGRAIDATGIMFRMLNTSKGPAVRGPRAQADKYAYAAEVQRLLSTRSIDVYAGTADELLIEDGRVAGLLMPPGSGLVSWSEEAIAANHDGTARAVPVYEARAAAPSAGPLPLRAKAVVITTGTFLRGLMHTGETKTAGGRVGEGAAQSLSTQLAALGFELGRLKTGTPPRLALGSIEWDSLEAQAGDAVPVAFSDRSPDVLPAGRFPHLEQTECRFSATCAETHELIRANLHRAPMYDGQIDAETGPRYCPSIEDKVVRFADRDTHHVFLEPESLHTEEVYCNGISTSLPADVQDEIVRRLPGCGNARILKYGYAVEYDMVWPHQIDATTMTKRIAGLFLAGQINCTTGYEEAAAQGVIAGLNAARLARGESLRRFGRDEGYLGVMMDDLVTKTPREPYRMFTSRAEHRLVLRADNADDRLTPLGIELGLIDREHRAHFERRSAARDNVRRALEVQVGGGRTLREIARRPQTTVETVRSHLGSPAAGADHRDIERVIVEARYEGYLGRQRAEIRRRAESEHRAIPDWLDPHAVTGLRSEAAEVIARFRPATLGQAGRLSGVNPADVTLLDVAIRRGRTRLASASD